jgi:hypothetical protein
MPQTRRIIATRQVRYSTAGWSCTLCEKLLDKIAKTNNIGIEKWAMTLIVNFISSVRLVRIVIRSASTNVAVCPSFSRFCDEGRTVC